SLRSPQRRRLDSGRRRHVLSDDLEQLADEPIGRPVGKSDVAASAHNANEFGSDNLESVYARDALRQFYRLIHGGKVEQLSLKAFESATGRGLCDKDGTLREELPPISTFLNRLLALPGHQLLRRRMLFASCVRDRPGRNDRCWFWLSWPIR